VKHSVSIDRHKTSVSLEEDFFEALKEIAKERGTTWQDLVSKIKAERLSSNLSSGIRISVLRHYRAR